MQEHPAACLNGLLQVRHDVKGVCEAVLLLAVLAINLHTLFDIGNVYPTISDFGGSDLRKTAWVGLRLCTPFLMIRSD